MLRLWAALLLLSGVRALLCPDQDGYRDGGDGSCYTSVTLAEGRDYINCADANAYLPIVMNAFDNTALQSSTKQSYVYPPLSGMWLGLTCNGNVSTSCSWDNGIPLTNNSYSNFEPGFPNITIGTCVYQDVTTARWKSESCLFSTGIGDYCKFTPTNNVPMCKIDSNENEPRSILYPEYFDGYCYNAYEAKTIEEAEKLCIQKCGHVVSIHSEAENSVVRDLYFKISATMAYPYDGITSGYLGMKANDTQWFDGTPVDYTHYAATSNSSGPCYYLAINVSEISPGYWYLDNCTQPLYYETKLLVCKKPLVNDCDGPYEAFPTHAPAICTGPERLLDNTYGTAYSPGNPYYPYGQEPNHCEYIQKMQEGLRPTFDVFYSEEFNFQANYRNISMFEFYSTEDENAAPFYTYDGDLYNSFPNSVISPTNVMRAVYTTKGDNTSTYDWYRMEYYATQSLSCSIVMDYSYLGYYNETADSWYYLQNNKMVQFGRDMKNYRTRMCKIGFAWNSAAFGNVNSTDSILYPPNYSTTDINTYIASTGADYVDLCTFIDQLNSFTVPPGTENPCLIFVSGRSAEDFVACNPVNTEKFKYTFGVAINAQTGVSTFTSDIFNVTQVYNNMGSDLVYFVTGIVQPSLCYNE